jgi:hypothetical protein
MITVYDANTTLAELEQVELRRPDGAGAVWRGVPHAELVHTVLDEARMKGWQPGKMGFSLARHGADMVGAIDLRLPGITPPDGMGFSIGLINSNSRRQALRLMVGAEVAVCHNGIATGTVVVQHKHTNRFQLDEAVDSGLDAYAEKAGRLHREVEYLQEKQLAAATVVEIIDKAGEEEVMPRTRLWGVAREYLRPSYPQHGHGTGWALLNAFTLLIKKSPPHVQMQNMNRFRQLILAA